MTRKANHYITMHVKVQFNFGTLLGLDMVDGECPFEQGKKQLDILSASGSIGFSHRNEVCCVRWMSQYYHCVLEGFRKAYLIILRFNA